MLPPEQVSSIASKLKEPYSTLVLFLYATGLRISEAIGIKPSDISGNVVSIQRRIYERDIDDVKTLRSVRHLPVDDKLLSRLKAIGDGHEWVFRSRAGTPLNPGNVLKRYLRPVTKSLGIKIGGWHDFRHTLTTTLRRQGTHPKVLSDILGQKRVNLAMDVYDRTDVQDFVAPLSAVTQKLEDVTKCDQAQASA